MKKIICLLLWWNLGFASAWAQGQKVVQFFPLSAADLPAPVAQPARPEPWTGLEPGPVSGLRVFADGAKEK